MIEAYIIRYGTEKFAGAGRHLAVLVITLPREAAPRAQHGQLQEVISQEGAEPLTPLLQRRLLRADGALRGCWFPAPMTWSGLGLILHRGDVRIQPNV